MYSGRHHAWNAPFRVWRSSPPVPLSAWIASSIAVDAKSEQMQTKGHFSSAVNITAQHGNATCEIQYPRYSIDNIMTKARGGFACKWMCYLCFARSQWWWGHFGTIIGQTELHYYEQKKVISFSFLQFHRETTCFSCHSTKWPTFFFTKNNRMEMQYLSIPVLVSSAFQYLNQYFF